MTALVCWAGSIASARAAVLFAVTYPDSRISAHDADTGAVLYQFATPSPPQNLGGNGLAYSGTALYYTTINTPTIYTMDPVSGAVLNQFDRPVGADAFDALAWGEKDAAATLYGLSYTSNRLYRLSPTDGALLSFTTLSFDAVGGIDFNHDRGTLFVTDDGGRLRELNPDTGGVLTTGPQTGAFRTGLGIVGDRLFVAGQNGNQITEIDRLTGAILNLFSVSSGTVSGLAGGPAVPEPSTLVGSIACAVVGSLTRRRPASGAL